jgi:hypothetical protein
VTRLYPQELGSLFVASCDSQDYGGVYGDPGGGSPGVRSFHCTPLGLTLAIAPNESVLSLSLILRLTVSRPVCLGIKHPSGPYDQIFITARQLRVCWCGALCLTRGHICRLQLLLALASAVIFGPSPVGHEIIIYCLRFENSHFVASYDSQGYGGGIRPRLHTGDWIRSYLHGRLYSYSLAVT